MLRSVALTVLALAACTGWVVNKEPIPAYPNLKARPIRVHLASGNSVVLSNVYLRHDSLIGMTKDEREVAFASSGIASIERQVVDGWKTALGVMTVTAIVAGGIAMGSGQDADEGSTPNQPPGAPPPPPKRPPPPTGSCPLVYSWDGSEWRLDSGTFGGAITRGLQRTDIDGLDHLTPVDGLLRLRVTNELEETDHIDALQLLVVDHPVDTRMAPDPAGGLHVLRALEPPRSARDFSGADALARVRTADGYGWESPFVQRDTSRMANARDGLELRFVRPSTAEAHLVLDGNNTTWATTLLTEWLAYRGPGLAAWYDAMNRNPAMARRVGLGVANEAFLTVSVQTGSTWTRQGLYWESGPEVSKRQTVHLDLRGVTGNEVVVRLEAPPSFWWIDAVSLEGARDESVRIDSLKPFRSRSHDRSNVLPRLAAIDSDHLTLETGEWTELDFAAPTPRPAVQRSYVLSSTGWYQIDVRPRPVAESALLERIEKEPGALSRISTGMLNDAIRAVSAPR